MELPEQMIPGVTQAEVTQAGVEQLKRMILEAEN